MKNVHVLPTEKRSNLFKDINGKLGFHKNWIEIPIGRINQNICITNDEEIKDGDWFMIFTNKKPVAPSKAGLFDSNCKKIILTTDVDLIKDGVQAIDDKFLEWFVKNPSCESVEVEKGCVLYDFKYKIIIPKEETQPELEITNFNIEVNLTETEEIGKAIADYLKKYSGQPIYNDIALAIQFGYQLALKNDTKG